MSIYSGKDPIWVARRGAVTDGLVAHWDSMAMSAADRFGTRWLDLSGNNNHGTLVGGAAFDRIGCNFDGNGAHVICGYSSLFDLSITKTVSVWIFSRSFDGSFQSNDIISTDNIANTRTWQFAAIDSNNNDIDASIGIYSFGTGGGQRDIRTAEILNINRWYHIAFTTPDKLATVSNIKIYIDGIERATTDNSSGTFGEANTLISSNTLNIGRRPGHQGIDLHFNGFIDDVRCYNRVLSSSEILRNFNAIRARFGV